MKLFLPLVVALALSTKAETLYAAEHAAATKTESTEPETRRVEWRPEWRRVSGWEVAGSVTLGASIGAIILFADEGEPKWKAGGFIDDPVRDTLRAETHQGRKRAQIIGDMTYYGALAYPIVVDVVATAWIGHGKSDVAGQMLLMDLEAMSVSGFLSFVSNALIRRQRPYVRECNKPEDQVFPDCKLGGQSEGFFSGHTAIAATTAGLTCAHHAALPLYGGGIGDTMACIGTIAGAVVTGYTRLIADKHYLLDVVVGFGLGFPIGYGFARYHYAHPSPKQAAGKASTWSTARLVPNLGLDRFGFSLVGPI